MVASVASRRKHVDVYIILFVVAIVFRYHYAGIKERMNTRNPRDILEILLGDLPRSDSDRHQNADFKLGNKCAITQASRSLNSNIINDINIIGYVRPFALG